MSNHDLDSAKTYQELDPQGMFRYLSEMPAQCRRAWDLAGSFSLPPDYREINKVVILGMGGSAIGADLVASLATAEGRAPVIVVRDYALPAYVDAQTLVIANSYSGNTEETLSAFGQALKNDCKKLAITTGGKLAKTAGLTGIPVFTYDYPASPRAALSYSLLPLLRFLQNLGIINEKTADVAEAVAVLGKLTDELNAEVPASRNAAKQLAQRVYGKLPVIYGAEVL
ncbi:MAG: bifunctional phosphoglucose/phosphomannose isomerase, partial [Pseudomonadota bacterium]